ncbi:phosphatidylglycerophosphatase A [Comamonas testosteroni]|uniref:phosphatidylglycerophosphatase A family protein n=1 Tax=Comamonas testosteroni TaxID=285 RepID=UPI00265E471F|nr:phosphatidylglycerophosphatase A [Comamonas testosteroni]WKL13583.1 phosphatidylglycerophosphatase A [Comamonas testosteroni]WQD42923.1 phosphatidylglycerophosphatase A [Comamonas testosteroni]
MTDDLSNSAAAHTDIAQAAINNKARNGMSAAAIAHPSVGFMLQHPAHLIALGFGSGLPRVAPGTVGSLWAWLAYLVLALWLSPAQIGWLIAASIPLGWWACTVTARHMRVADPGHIVWDEVVAMWIVLWLCMPMGFWGQLACFALFRFFDAVKPQPVKWADRLFKGFGPRGGWGIMWDDLVAAFCTLLVVALWRHFF